MMARKNIKYSLIMQGVYNWPHSGQTLELFGVERKKAKHTSNLNSKFWPVIKPCWHILDIPQRQHPVDHLSENNINSIKKMAFFSGDEELANYTAELQQSEVFGLPDIHWCFDPRSP